MFRLMASGDGSCPTYPYHCIVPKPVAELVKVATFKILPTYLPNYLFVVDKTRLDEMVLA